MMLVHYPTKKDLKAAVGRPLRYTETSMFGEEYKANGRFTVAHRPAVQHDGGQEFFATVTMRDGLIAKVE